MAASIAQVLGHLPCWNSDAVLLERYLHQHDEAAFAALVARHGTMVLRLCRRILGDTHAAEDAFQATFLILARKAHSLKQPDALPAWLYGVARRVALKARGQSSRRAAAPLEESLPDPRPDPLMQLTAREVLDILDEEVRRLPVSQRSAFVLCCLEGQTQDEAARILGSSIGSIKGLLERGRRRLQLRLKRRGVALSAALALVTVAREQVSARVPALLLQSTVRAAFGGSIGSTASALAQSVLKVMFLTKLAGVLTVTLTVALAASTTIALVSRVPMAEAPEDKKPAVPARAKDGGTDKPQTRTDALGDLLPAGAIARLGTVRFRHGAPIDRLLFTADGKNLISKGDDGVRVWDAVTGKELRRLTPPPGENWVQATDLSSDGERLAVIHGPDSAIDFWSIRHGRKIDSFGKGDYSLVRISPDGNLVAVCTFKNAGIEIWDVKRRAKLSSWKAHKWQVWFFVFTSDSRRLLTTSPEGQVRLWDAATGRQFQELTLPDYSVQMLCSIPLSPDANLLAVIHENEKPKEAGRAAVQLARLSVWDMTTGKQLRQLTCPSPVSSNGYSPRFGALTFTPDGKRLLTSGPDRFLRVWDPRTGEELRKIPFDPRGARVLALSKDGKTLAAGTNGMAIHLLDLPSGKAHEPPEGQAVADSHPYFALLTPDGRTAITASWDHTAVVWNVDAGRVRQQIGKPNTSLNFLQLSRDGKTLFSHDYDQVLRGWDLAHGEERFQVQLNYIASGMSRDMIVSPDNRSLFLADTEGMIHQLNAATGKERHQFQGPKFLWGMAYSPDGPSLVGWSGDRKIRVWDATTGRLRHEHAVPRNIEGKVGFGPNGEHVSHYSAALSPDGRLLAMDSSHRHNLDKQKDRYALMFKDLKTGRDITHCAPFPSAPELLRFSPDGRMLAWSGSFFDPTIHLMEVAGGRERRCLVGHRGRITALSFSADGRRLLSGSNDTTALVWDLSGTAVRRRINSAELEALWADLAGEDADRAYQAIHQLAAAPDAAIPFLRKHLRPVHAVDAKHLERLVTDLDSDEFATRQQAAEELAKFGEQAVPAYRKALESKPALESRRRLEDLLEKAQSAWWNSSGERLRSLRALEVLELAGTTEARNLLASLAAGSDGARLTEEAKAAQERLANTPR